MLYLRFNDERKRLMREMEESKLILGTGNDSSRKKFDNKNSLDIIQENDEDDAGNASEEHDIYDNQSSKNSGSNKNQDVFSNEEDEDDDEEKEKSDDESKKSENSNSKSEKSEKSPKEENKSKVGNSGKQINKQASFRKSKSNISSSKVLESEDRNQKKNSTNDKEKGKEKEKEETPVNFFNFADANKEKKNSILEVHSLKESIKSKSQGKEGNKDKITGVAVDHGNSIDNLNKSKKKDNEFLKLKAQQVSKSGATPSANNSSGEDSSFNHSSIKEANRKPIKSNYNEKEINLLDFKTQKSGLSNMSNFNKEKGENYESDKTSNAVKTIAANPEINQDMEMIAANDMNYMNMEMSEHFEKKRNLINQTFLEKVEKIIAFLEENKIEFSADNGENPLELLKRLRDIQDINERNEMIDKIETIVAELFKSENSNQNNDES